MVVWVALSKSLTSSQQKFPHLCRLRPYLDILCNLSPLSVVTHNTKGSCYVGSSGTESHSSLDLLVLSSLVCIPIKIYPPFNVFRTMFLA